MRFSYSISQTPDTPDGGVSLLQGGIAALVVLAIIAVAGAAVYARRHQRQQRRIHDTLKQVLRSDEKVDMATILYLLQKSDPTAKISSNNVRKMLASMSAQGEVDSSFVEVVESYATVRREVFSLPSP